MQRKPKKDKFSGWMKAMNTQKAPPPIASQLQLTVRTHTNFQSYAQILLSPDFNLGVEIPDIILIQIDQVSQPMLVQVSAQSLEENPISTHQFSILKNIADLFPINYDEKGRFKAKLKKLSPNNYSNYNIEFVEVLLKNQCISQYDRYRIAKQLVMRTIYPLKTLDFEKVRVQIFNMLSSGDIPKMGILTQNTKVIYRTGSASHTILIEFTKDMFDLDFYQQMYVERVVQLLKVYNLRNGLFQVNHNIQIVLFARMYYPQFHTLNQAYDFMVGEVEKIKSEEASNINSINLAVAFQKDSKDRIYEDCYRKIIWCQHYGSLTAFVWKKIGEFLYTINWKQKTKPLAARILQRVETQMAKGESTSSSSQYGLGNPDLKIRPFIHFLQCQLSDSETCNILQAIILAASQQGKFYYGTNLGTTGNAITVVSAGHSKYYTDPATYKLAKSTVYLTNISCMLINLREKKSNLEIIQVMGPSNLVEENSDSKMNLLIYGCLDALIYSSPLFGEQYQHPHCFENRMAIKLSHLKQITVENQRNYFKHINLQKLQCGHDIHYVLKEDFELSSTTSYEEKKKNPQWITYCYFGKKSLRLHNKYYAIPEGLDPAQLYLYGESKNEIETLPTFRHADQQLFEVTSLKKIRKQNKNQQKLNQIEIYHCQSNIQELGLKLLNPDIQMAIFQNQVCPKVYLTKVITSDAKKHDSCSMLQAITKAVFHEQERIERIESENMYKKSSKKSFDAGLGRLLMNKASSIFQNDKFSLSEMGPCMFFSSFVRRVSSQFKSRLKHNFVDLQIHYLNPWFSSQTLRNLKGAIFRDSNATSVQISKTQRQFDMEWNWKLFCFPLLTPISTASDLQGLRVIPRQNTTSTNAANVKLLVGQKLCEGFQLIEDPEKISGSFDQQNQLYHLMKGHLYYPIQILGAQNLIIKQCQVIDKNSNTSRTFPNNQDLIKTLQNKYSDMLYRYLCYEEKQFRFVPKRTYFKNDNSWHKIKDYNERCIKISLVINVSTEQTVSAANRQRNKLVCSESFKQFINALNNKFKNQVPNFAINIFQGPADDCPVDNQLTQDINRIPIKLGYLHPQLQIFRNDTFYLNYQASWNPDCTYNLTLSWNGCLGIYVNQFLNTILSMAKFGKKIMPCQIPSEPIFQTEWKFESPAEIVFEYEISMDILDMMMQDGWVWDRNGFYFKKDGFSFVKFYKEKKLVLWKDNYKQIVDAKEVPENQFFNFFIKASAIDIIGEILEKMFV